MKARSKSDCLKSQLYRSYIIAARTNLNVADAAGAKAREPLSGLYVPLTFRAHYCCCMSAAGNKLVLVTRVAALLSYEQVIKLLLGAYAEVDARDNDNRTPLHFCSETGYTDTIKVNTMHATTSLNFERVDMCASHSTRAVDYCAMLSCCPGSNSSHTPVLSWRILRQSMQMYLIIARSCGLQ